MARLPLDFARAWVEFPDPQVRGQRFRCDLTWLTSRWTCVFGRGCPGIYADRPDDGCCTLGAHFTEEADFRNVERVARSLGPHEWQHRPEGEALPEQSWTELEDGQRKTRLVDGACVLLNRPSFEAEAGCALHLRALREGRRPLQGKPEVCWQLPIRRAYRTVPQPDGTEYLEVTITEFDRRAWGPGGHELDWYCSGSPRAHVGAEPVYRSCRGELVELIGEAAYAVLAAHCASYLDAHQPPPVGGQDSPSPGLVPLLHPATLAAQRAASSNALRRAQSVGATDEPASVPDGPSRPASEPGGPSRLVSVPDEASGPAPAPASGPSRPAPSNPMLLPLSLPSSLPLGEDGGTHDAAGAVRSPNVWSAPDVYELENRGVDRAGLLESRIRELGGWAGRDVVDLGCGTGFHLPRFARQARQVFGVEPHALLVRRARTRVARAGLTNATVQLASAQDTGLPDASTDVAHARWAYFFGPGCEPGLAELERILRPGGTAYVIDVDATASTYGEWFRGAWPTYDPAAVERFWRRHGWHRERLTIAWEQDRRADFESVVRLEFTPVHADRILVQDPHRVCVDYAVNLWWRRF